MPLMTMNAPPASPFERRGCCLCPIFSLPFCKSTYMHTNAHQWRVTAKTLIKQRLQSASEAAVGQVHWQQRNLGTAIPVMLQQGCVAE